MNHRFAGQVLRLIGLAIEMLGILAGVLSSRQDTNESTAGFVPTFRMICFVVGTGFVLWLAGTILTYWPGRVSPGQNAARKGSGDLEL